MKTTQNNSIHDVIIAGAGPVGLFLACELALAKCLVLILEKAEDPDSPLKQVPFGIRGLNALSVERYIAVIYYKNSNYINALKTPT